MYIPNCWLNKYIGFPENSLLIKIANQLTELGLETEFSKNIWQFTPLSNRLDLLSWWGIAKEINSLLNFPLREEIFLSNQLKNDYKSSEIKIKVTANECSQIDLILLTDFKIEPTKEQWIKECLESNHISLINNIVDASNLIMLELGQPSNLYDYDKLPNKKEFIIHKAIQEEKFLNLFGKELNLDQEKLVISSGNEVICLAGIVGSQKTKIDEKSTNILIEIANFDSQVIKKTSQNLNLITKSSQYFSKKAHLPLKALVIDRFIELTKRKPKIFSWVEKNFKENEKSISIEHSFIEKKLGMKIEPLEIENIWKKLNFNYKLNNNEYLITIPNWRLDLKSREDLLKEINLFLNYNELPSYLPIIQTVYRDKNQSLDLKKSIKDYLVNSSYQEIITYSLIDKDSKKYFLNKKSSFSKIVNPKNEIYTYYRQSSLPSHLRTIAYNISHQNKNLFFFEINDIYFSEKQENILTLSGTGKIFNCLAHKLQEEIDFFWIKGTLENLFKRLNILKKISFSPGLINQMHSYQTADIFLEDENIGFVGQIDDSLVRKKYQIKQKVFGAQILLDKIKNFIKKYEKIDYKPISLFPQVERDLSFVFDKNIKANEIIEVVWKSGGELLTEVKIFDIYEEGEYKENQQKSLAFHLIFQGYQRTLSGEEVEEKIKVIVEEVKKSLGGKLREK